MVLISQKLGDIVVCYISHDITDRPTMAYQLDSVCPVTLLLIALDLRYQNINIFRFLMDFNNSFFICLPKHDAPIYIAEIASFYYL